MVWRRTLFGGTIVATLAASTMLLTNTTSWASAVSVDSDAVTVATSTTGAPQVFDATLSNALESLQNSGDTNSNSIQTFYSSYVTAQNDYQTAVTGATALYNSTFLNDPSGASAALVSNLNAARDTFVTAVDTAKDRLLTELNGGATTPVGTAFNTSFNSAISQYVHNSNGVTTQMEELSR